MTYTGTITDEQMAAVHATRDEHMRIGLSTERCDRPAAESAVQALYATHGLDAPLVVWMDSPLGGLYAYGALSQLGDQLWGQLRGQLWGQLRDQLRGQIGDQLGGQLWDQLRGQLRGQLRDQLWGQLWGQLGGQLGGQLWGQLGGQLWGQLRDQLGGQLWGQLRGQLRDQLGGQLRGQLGDQLWGQLRGQLRDQLWDQIDRNVSLWWDGYWIAVLRHSLAIAPMATDSRLNGLADVCASAGWWWPYRGLAILTDRPTVLNRDGQARLHCESGPALAYADGYDLHAWHGVRVPRELIAGQWSTKDILRESNAEVRRCGIERMGWDRFVVDAGLSQIGTTVPDPGNPGHHLALYDVPEAIYDEPVRVLLCDNATPERDGTRRRFGLTVPADISDPVAAAAWTFDLDPHLYQQLQHAY